MDSGAMDGPLAFPATGEGDLGDHFWCPTISNPLRKAHGRAFDIALNWEPTDVTE